jgi:hypothetical protein
VKSNKWQLQKVPRTIFLHISQLCVRLSQTVPRKLRIVGKWWHKFCRTYKNCSLGRQPQENYRLFLLRKLGIGVSKKFTVLKRHFVNKNGMLHIFCVKRQARVKYKFFTPKSFQNLIKHIHIVNMKDISRGDTIPRTLSIFLFLKLCTRVTTETYTIVGLSKTVRCRKNICRCNIVRLGGQPRECHWFFFCFGD